MKSSLNLLAIVFSFATAQAGETVVFGDDLLLGNDYAQVLAKNCFLDSEKQDQVVRIFASSKATVRDIQRPTGVSRTGIKGLSVAEGVVGSFTPQGVAALNTVLNTSLVNPNISEVMVVLGYNDLNFSANNFTTDSIRLLSEKIKAANKACVIALPPLLLRSNDRLTQYRNNLIRRYNQAVNEAVRSFNCRVLDPSNSLAGVNEQLFRSTDGLTMETISMQSAAEATCRPYTGNNTASSPSTGRSEQQLDEEPTSSSDSNH